MAFARRLSRRPWEAAVGSFREVSASARSARFSALCVSRARREELATLSSTGDGGTGEASLGLGLDGATAAWRARPVGRPTPDAADAGAGLFGISMSESKRDDVRRTSPCTNHALAFAQPGTRLPFRGATSRAGAVRCCAVLRDLLAVERCVEVGGGAGAAWAGGLRWHVAGWPGWRSFLVRVLVDGLLLLAAPKFLVLGGFRGVFCGDVPYPRSGASQLWHAGTLRAST